MIRWRCKWHTFDLNVVIFTGYKFVFRVQRQIFEFIKIFGTLWQQISRNVFITVFGFLFWYFTLA